MAQTKPKGMFKRIKGGLTEKQAAFVRHYFVSRNATEAAKAAGVPDKQAKSVGCQWLDEVRFPGVAKELQRLTQQAEMRAVRKADDVLQYIHTAMWLNPTDYFLPGGVDGGWLIDPERLESLPAEVKRLIEEIRIVKREVETEEGRTTTTMASVKLVSKAKAMELAAKHQLGEKVQVTTVNVPWDEIAAPPKVMPSQSIEDRIAAELTGEDRPIRMLPEAINLNGKNGSH